jgi:tetratricopeptide (TPR) repeat protein
MTAEQAKKRTRTKKTARDLFGDAFKAFGERKYDKASTLFAKLIESFPEEEEVLARARTFHRTCQRALEEKGRSSPRRSAEDHFDMGVFHHNNRDYAAALEHFRKALKSAGDDADYIHYAWAATKVQEGELDEGLAKLKQAAKIDPANLYHASNDPDFEPLEGHEEFRKLLGLRS